MRCRSSSCSQLLPMADLAVVSRAVCNRFRDVKSWCNVSSKLEAQHLLWGSEGIYHDKRTFACIEMHWSTPSARGSCSGCGAR